MDAGGSACSAAAEASAVSWPMEPADRNHGNKVCWDVIKIESTNGSFQEVSRSAEHKFGLNGKRQKIKKCS